MKETLNNALRIIDVPDDLSESVSAGIMRAKLERNGITMKRSAKKIAAVAAVFAICAVATIGVLTSKLSITKEDNIQNTKPIIYENATGDISLQLCGISDTGLLVKAAVNDAENSRLGNLSAVNVSDFTVVDKNGNIVADNEGLAGTYKVDTVVYKLDDDGNVIEGLEELHKLLDREHERFRALCEALENGYKLHVSSLTGVDENGNQVEIYGNWEADIVVDTVLDGSAFVAEEGDVSVEFVLNEDGSQDLVITMNDTGKYPYSEVVAIWPSVYFTFDEAGNMLGASQQTPGSRAVRGATFGIIFKTIEKGQITIVNAEYGHYTMHIYDMGIELANGEFYELQGFWETSFDGNIEPRKEGEVDEQFEAWKKENDEWREDFEASMNK